ncbi:MAG: nitrate/nitrite transporter NrtS [Chloroflexota bacterium]
MKDFLLLCISRNIVRRAGYTALVVGTLLTVINHGDALLHGQMDPTRVLKIILTVCVPYIVSTVSSASTVLSMRKGQS